jgi:hypothetical protein
MSGRGRLCCKSILQALSRNIDSSQSATTQLRFAASAFLILLLRRRCPPTSFATQSAQLGRTAFSARCPLSSPKRSSRRQIARPASCHKRKWTHRLLSILVASRGVAFDYSIRGLQPRPIARLKFFTDDALTSILLRCAQYAAG